MCPAVLREFGVECVVGLNYRTGHELVVYDTKYVTNIVWTYESSLDWLGGIERCRSWELSWLDEVKRCESATADWRGPDAC
jgi:hypothetical protein